MSHELEVRISIREAKYHLDRLLTDRKEMVSSLKDLKDRIDVDAPPAKVIFIAIYRWTRGLMVIKLWSFVLQNHPFRKLDILDSVF